LADFLPKLDTLTFQAKLGSMLDKVHRLAKLTPEIGEMLTLSAKELASATRAAELSKADLGSSLVVEMTSLQGVMGGQYARMSGEPEAVALAIAEQYNSVSETRAGLALALADRLDSLAGLFAVGLGPKGSNDPFALRRAALQLIENLVANGQSFDLRMGLAKAAQLLPVPCDETVLDAVLAFINGRLEVALREQGHAVSVVKAVLAEQGYDPFTATNTAVALTSAIKEEDWTRLLDAYARCVRITRSQEAAFTLRPDEFTLAEEQNLYQAYAKVGQKKDGTMATLLTSLRVIEPAVTAFFDAVLVMDEDTAVRENRLALLQHIAGLASGIADLSELEGF
jgi:glycyl-tRNA synthetase